MRWLWLPLQRAELLNIFYWKNDIKLATSRKQRQDILECLNWFSLASQTRKAPPKQGKKSNHVAATNIPIDEKIPFKFILNRSQNWLISRKLESGNKRMPSQMMQTGLVFFLLIFCFLFLFVCRFVSLAYLRLPCSAVYIHLVNFVGHLLSTIRSDDDILYQIKLFERMKGWRAGARDDDHHA